MKYHKYKNFDELETLEEMGLPVLHPNRKKRKETKLRQCERRKPKYVKQEGNE